MIIFDEDRPSDSPYVERVWRSHSEGADPFLSIATSRCELVLSRLEGEISVTMRGPETKATQMGDCPGGGEWFGIILSPGVYLPLLPGWTDRPARRFEKCLLVLWLDLAASELREC